MESDILSTSVAGAVLAGGKATRMGGRSKGLISVGGRPIIQTAALVLTRVFREVWIVTNTPDESAFLELPMTHDVYAGCGSLGGIHAGLTACRASRAFVMGCDMPFPSEEAVRLTATIAGEGYDVVIPRIRGHLEPLHAVYSKRCLPYIERLIRESDFKILHLLDQVRVYEIPESEFVRLDPSLSFLINVNTPGDVTRARLLAAGNDRVRS
jgi:molybdenum cofactor guanylyltransferase